MKKTKLISFYRGSIVLMLLFVLLGMAATPAHALVGTTTTLDGQASCEALGGTWEVTLINTCEVTDLTINVDEILTISSEVHLNILGIVNNDGTINFEGVINNYGTIHNNNTLNLVGNIYNVPQLDNLGGSVINNNAGGNINIIDSIFLNHGTFYNKFGGIIKNDSGQIANFTTITNQGITNIINNGILNIYDFGVFLNIGELNINHGIIRNYNIFYNSGVLDGHFLYFYNLTSGSYIANDTSGIIHSYYLETNRILNNGTINNNNYLVNYREFTNNGTLNNKRLATIENYTLGDIINNGNLTNDWLITNKGAINNNNLIENSGTITSEGNLNNNAGATFYNISDGTLINNDTLTNDWILHNAGMFTNNSAFTNTNTVFNTGEIVNNGEIQNLGPFESTEGTINNECSGIISGDWEIDGVITDACDHTPPVITYTISGELGNNNWYTSDVTVRWTLTDPESIVNKSDCLLEITFKQDTDWVSLSCSGTSEGGTSTETINIRRDATVPTADFSVSPAPNNNGWNNTDVSVSFTGTDNLSGLAGCEATVVLSGEGANQSASGTCTDLAGNVSAPASANNINIDKTAPNVFVTGVVDGETYILGNVPQAGCDTRDSLSGVAAFASLTLSGGDENGLGTIVATCDGALDNSENSGSASVAYDVITAQQGTENLESDIQSLVEDETLKTGQANGLLKPLDNAIRSLDKGNVEDACNQLNDFIVKVEDKTPDLLDAATAAELIDSAEALKSSIGCQ